MVQGILLVLGVTLPICGTVLIEKHWLRCLLFGHCLGVGGCHNFPRFLEGIYTAKLLRVNSAFWYKPKSAINLACMQVQRKGAKTRQTPWRQAKCA